VIEKKFPEIDWEFFLCEPDPGFALRTTTTSTRSKWVRNRILRIVEMVKH